MAYIGKTPTIGNFQVCDAISVVNNQAAYTMKVDTVNVSPESSQHMLVSLNGVIQKNGGTNPSFTVSGSTITFASNLVTGDVIDFIQILGNVLDLGVPSDATVSTAKIVDGAVTSAKLASGVGGVDGISSSANATAMTITSAEKIGIGETSPLGLVHIKTADSGASANGDADELIIENGTSGASAGISILSATNGYGAINFGDSGDDNIGIINYDHPNNAMKLFTNGAERMRIDSNGKVGIATANANFNLTVSNNSTETSLELVNQSTTGNHRIVDFVDGAGSLCGNITINTGSNVVAYNTSSDYRLKENVDYTFDATTRLKQLKPARFNFIKDTDTTVDGFLAHEVSSIVPEAIFGNKNAVQVWKEGEELPDGISVGDFKLDEDGNKIPEYQGIDQSKLVPLLVKTIQELEARITTLENA